jgi:hypothetical protein
MCSFYLGRTELLVTRGCGHPGLRGTVIGAGPRMRVPTVPAVRTDDVPKPSLLPIGSPGAAATQAFARSPVGANQTLDLTC